MTAHYPLPNFLFIGPDKTGSSWLYEILRLHPQCYVPTIKDIYFFDRYYERGLRWYSGFFQDAPPSALAVGELSHDYLFSRAAAERIAQDLPGVRLLTCLRSPADRTFSHYLYLVRSGLTQASFEEAIEAFPELVHNSLYGKHLATYLEIFPRERLKVLLFDDLQRDAEALAAQVFEYLGVAFQEDLPYKRQVLPASHPRSSWLARIAKSGANLARDLNLAGLVGVVKRSVVREMLYRPYAQQQKPKLSPMMRGRLNAVFAPDLLELEGLLGRPLPNWTEPAG